MNKIEGRNPVLESLRAGKQMKKIFIKRGISKDPKIHKIIALAAKNKLFVNEVSVLQIQGIGVGLANTIKDNQPLPQGKEVTTKRVIPTLKPY